MIKAIIFDLGKVIFDTSFDRCFDFWASASGKTFESIKNKFSFDSIYENFERSDITPSQFRKQMCEKLDLQISDELFDKGWCNLYLDVYPGIHELLSELKQNYRLIALSNTNCIHENVWKIRYAEILRHFENVFSSHHINTRKPEKESYFMVLEHCKLTPSEVIFLDDNADNIVGAQKAQINSILVTSTEQMILELHQQLRKQLE